MANGIATPNAPTTNTAAALAAEYAIGDDAPASAAPSEGGNSATAPTSSAPAASAPQTPAEVASPGAKHGARLVRTAQSLGIDAETITKSDPAALADLVFERQEARAASNVAAQQEAAARPLPARNEAGQFVKADGTPDVAAIQKAGGIATEDIGFKFDFGKADDGTEYTDADLHPALASAFKQVSKELTEVQQMKKAVMSLLHAEHGRVVLSNTQKLDAAFAALPAEYEPWIGKGGRAELADDGPELLIRQAIVNKTNGLDPKLPLPQQIAEAAKSVLAGKALPAPIAAGSGTPVRTPAGTQAEDWKSAGLSVPTQRSGAGEAPGYNKAVQNLTNRMREAGMDPAPAAAADDTLSQFPD